MKASKILVVDDSHINLTLISEILEAEGYDVAKVTSGETALSRVKAHKFDLILLDIMMPVMDGFQVCERIKQDAAIKEIPIIFLTAKTDNRSLLKGFETGAVDYVKKPFERLELLARVQTHLELKNAREALEIELNERKKAEKNLKISETKYKSLFSSANDAIFLMNDNGEFVETNEKATIMLGYTSEELYEKKSWEISPEHQPDGNLSKKKSKEYIALANQGKPQVFYWQHQGKENELIDVQVSLNSLELENQLFTQAIVRDITREKKAERILKKSEEKHRKLSKELKERVKELNCLYNLTQITENRRYSIDEVLQKTIKIIPDGWQYPELTVVKIIYQDKVYKSNNYSYKNINRTYPINISNEPAGSLEVGYLNKHEKLKHNIFLKEEYDLQKAIAQRLGLYIEYHLAEIALINNYNFLETLINTIPNPIFYKDTDGKYQGCNTVFAELIMGLPRETIIGKSVIEFQKKLSKEKVEKYRQMDNKLLEEKNTQKYEEKVICADGKKRDFLFSKAVYYDNHNQLKGIVGIMLDITERKQAEQAIKESEDKYRTLFNRNNDAVFIYHLDDNNIPKPFTEVNRQACKMLQYKRDELMQLSPLILGKVNKTQWLPIINKVLRKGSQVFESFLHSKNDLKIPVEISSQVFMYKNQRTIMSVARDITERRELQRKIMNAIIQTEERERNRFAKDLHDGLGALLSSINIYLNLLELGKINPSELHTTIRDMKELLNEAITSSKEIANNIRPNVLTNFGLTTSINSFCNKLNSAGIISIQFNSNKFNYQLDVNIETIFYRIINELINNTLKHASAKNVFIQLWNEADMIYLCYKDNGIGFNVDETLAQNNKGMGLQNIINRVESLNGSISINSKHNKGTEVNISIKASL